MNKKKIVLYNKLVRNKIPAYLEEKGLSIKVRRANDKEIFEFLLKKLSEEISELIRSFSKENLTEEVVDVLDVLEAIRRFKKISKSKIKQVRITKNKEKGNFSKRLILIEVYE